MGPKDASSPFRMSQDCRGSSWEQRESPPWLLMSSLAAWTSQLVGVPCMGPPCMVGRRLDTSYRCVLKGCVVSTALHCIAGDVQWEPWMCCCMAIPPGRWQPVCLGSAANQADIPSIPRVTSAPPDTEVSHTSLQSPSLQSPKYVFASSGIMLVCITVRRHSRLLETPAGNELDVSDEPLSCLTAQ